MIGGIEMPLVAAVYGRRCRSTFHLRWNVVNRHKESAIKTADIITIGGIKTSPIAAVYERRGCSTFHLRWNVVNRRKESANKAADIITKNSKGGYL